MGDGLKRANAAAKKSRTPAYRVRMYSDGRAWHKGAWIFYRHSFSDIAKAREAAESLAKANGILVRVTTGTSVKALAEFDGREA